MITFLAFYIAKSQTIDGEFKGNVSTEKIYLKYYPDLMGFRHEGVQSDSSLIKNGRFHFDFKAEAVPKLGKLIQMKRNKETGLEEYLGEIRFFLANDSIVIYTNDSLKNTKIFNSSINYDAAIFAEMISSANQKVFHLNDNQNLERNEIPLRFSQSLYYGRYQSRRRESLIKERALQYNKFIKDNPYSWISLYAFTMNLSQNNNYFSPEIVELYNGLGNKLKKSELGISLGKRIEAKSKVQLGAMAPLFQLKDTNGVQVNLSDYRGKYVLLEFWASWCGGCRFEAPFLKMAYSKYKKSGFEILSVSLDEEGLRYSGRKAWLKAISEDGTGLWKHVSDLKGFKSPVAVLYDLYSIPQNYLIDPSGKIISGNLRGADLQDKLEDIFYQQ